MFECPYCGWSIDGGDETGLHIEPPYELSTLGNDGNYFPEVEAECRIKYCFHCGKKQGGDSDE